MIRQIAPQFFTTDMRATLTYYRDKLGFECLGTWQDPPVYAIVARDGHRIHFRCAGPPSPSPDKYDDELLDAYLFVDDADAMYSEFAARGVEFTRDLGDTAWRSREFVLKDCDGRLVAVGAHLEQGRALSNSGKPADAGCRPSWASRGAGRRARANVRRTRAQSRRSHG
jgi:uncharacterized glyoxalase superfamily protein PhnB